MKTIEVVAAMLMHQDKLLIARRHPSASQGGLWEFPGGKVEPQESQPLALKRELKEELNIQAEVGPKLEIYRHDYGDKVVELHGYLCHWQPQPIELDGSHDQIEWICPHRLDPTRLAPADIPLLNALRAHLLNHPDLRPV